MPIRKIVIIDGHPDQREDSFCRALVGAYASGAAAAGHGVRRVTLAHIDIPLLRSRTEWENGEPLPALGEAWEAIVWADHLVIVYPLWLGSAPALLKAFFEQVFRPGLAIGQGKSGFPHGLLRDKSARIVVTMGTPALVYRLFFFSHGLSALKRNILKFVGIRPVATTLIGSIETIGQEKRLRWLRRIEAFGRKGR